MKSGESEISTKYEIILLILDLFLRKDDDTFDDTYGHLSTLLNYLFSKVERFLTSMSFPFFMQVYN